MAVLQRTTARLVPKLPSARRPSMRLTPEIKCSTDRIAAGRQETGPPCLFGRCGTVASGAAITVSAPSADFDAPRKACLTFYEGVPAEAHKQLQ